MFCWYYKWKISSQHDDVNRPLSLDVSHHIERCQECREFYDLCRTMNRHRREDTQLTPQSALKVQQAVMQRLSSGQSAQSRAIKNYALRYWSVAAVIILLAIPAGVFWIVSNDINQILAREQQTSGGLNSLSEIVQQRWMEDTPAVNSNRTFVKPFEKQFRHITENGLQAAEFMFACLNPGITSAEDISEE